MTWDELFIRQAELIAQKSKDPSTKVGCIIVAANNAVLSTGFNGFPREVREIVQPTNMSDIQECLQRESDIPLTKALLQTQPVLDPMRWKSPEKYQWTEHAERNAIYNAARNGVALEGARLYLNWGGCPCSDCARAIIQVGIQEVIGPSNKFFEGRGVGIHYHTDYSEIMFSEARVRLRQVYVEF